MNIDPNQTYYIIPGAVLKLTVELLDEMQGKMSRRCANMLEEASQNSVPGSTLLELERNTGQGGSPKVK